MLPNLVKALDFAHCSHQVFKTEWKRDLNAVFLSHHILRQLNQLPLETSL